MSHKSVQANELREHLVINMRDFGFQPSLEDGTSRLSQIFGRGYHYSVFRCIIPVVFCLQLNSGSLQ